MKKVIFTLSIVVFLIVFGIEIYYIHTQNLSKSYISYCSDKSDDKCYEKVFNLLLPKLLIYDYKYKNEEYGKELARIVEWEYRPSAYGALKEADALFGYGIFDDIYFENNYSLFFNKPTYAFDCSISYEDIKAGITSEQCYFYPECIGTDKYVLNWLESNQKIHTFGQKIKELNLEDKKIYLKMDIAGGEIEVLPDILKHSDNITGMTITFHPISIPQLLAMKNILDEINKDFVLVTRNRQFIPVGNSYLHYYSSFNSFLVKFILLDRDIVLSYINKDLLKDYSISWNQNTDKLQDDAYTYIKTDDHKVTKVKSKYNSKDIEPNEISIIVVLNAKISNLKDRILKVQFKE